MPGLADDGEVRTRATGYDDGMEVVTAGCPERPGPAVLLVRPDGCTARTADFPGGPDAPDEVVAALRRWFGAPGEAVACTTAGGAPRRPFRLPRAARAARVHPDRLRPTPEPAPAALASDHDPHPA
ncbi:aromatic-ring hydroxylase C-terminal domain-containing protein [Streptomyces sp. NPDC054765]